MTIEERQEKTYKSNKTELTANPLRISIMSLLYKWQQTNELWRDATIYRRHIEIIVKCVTLFAVAVLQHFFNNELSLLMRSAITKPAQSAMHLLYDLQQ